MFLPPAPNKYSQDNENRARKLISEAIDALDLRVTKVEAGGTTPPPPPPTDPIPTSEFTFTLSGLTATFTDQSADVSPGTVVSWAWDFGDGATSTQRNPSHTYNSQATFSVTLVVHDNAGQASLPHTEQVVILSPSGQRAFFAIQNTPTDHWGQRPWPDTFITSSDGNAVVKAGGFIDDARAAGGRFFVRGLGGNAGMKDAGGFFDLAVAKGKWDEWESEVRAVNRVINGVTKNGWTIFREAVRDKIIPVFYTMDDFSATTGDNSFSRALVFEEFEGGVLPYDTSQNVVGLHQYIKSKAPWLPLMARARGQQFKSLAQKGAQLRSYTYTDASWGQFRFDNSSPSDPVAFASAEVTAATSVNLAWMGGANILDGGDWEIGAHPFSGATTYGDGTNMRRHVNVAWRTPLVGETLATYNQRLNPDSAKLFGMAPYEITAIANACMDNLSSFGFQGWAYSFAPDYLERADIKGALQGVYDAKLINPTTGAILRYDGPITRHSLPPA